MMVISIPDIILREALKACVREEFIGITRMNTKLFGGCEAWRFGWVLQDCLPARLIDVR